MFTLFCFWKEKKECTYIHWEFLQRYRSSSWKVVKFLVQGKNREYNRVRTRVWQAIYLSPVGHANQSASYSTSLLTLLRKVGQYKRERGVKTGVKSTCILFPKSYKDHWDTTNLSAFYYSYNWYIILTYFYHLNHDTMLHFIQHLFCTIFNWFSDH